MAMVAVTPERQVLFWWEDLGQTQQRPAMILWEAGQVALSFGICAHGQCMCACTGSTLLCACSASGPWQVPPTQAPGSQFSDPMGQPVGTVSTSQLPLPPSDTVSGDFSHPTADSKEAQSVLEGRSDQPSQPMFISAPEWVCPNLTALL